MNKKHTDKENKTIGNLMWKRHGSSILFGEFSHDLKPQCIQHMVTPDYPILNG